MTNIKNVLHEVSLHSEKYFSVLAFDYFHNQGPLATARAPWEAPPRLSIVSLEHCAKYTRWLMYTENKLAMMKTKTLLTGSSKQRQACSEWEFKTAKDVLNNGAPGASPLGHHDGFLHLWSYYVTLEFKQCTPLGLSASKWTWNWLFGESLLHRETRIKVLISIFSLCACSRGRLLCKYQLLLPGERWLCKVIFCNASGDYVTETRWENQNKYIFGFNSDRCNPGLLARHGSF